MASSHHTGNMFDIIASSFFQKKSCRLPGIGNLELVTTSAEYDFGSRQIKAPRQTILFVNAPSAGYFNEFSAISQLMKDELENKGIVEITGLGSFVKSAGGSIEFTAYPLNEEFLQPVAAEKVIHKDAEHSILVGDRERTNVQMNEYYTGQPVETTYKWWLWAAILGGAGIAAIALYIIQHGFAELHSLTSL